MGRLLRTQVPDRGPLTVGVASVGVVVLAFGVAAEIRSFGWDRPERWVSDLLVGLAFLAAGLATVRVARGPAALMVLMSLTWYLGGLLPAALLLHRGVLAHLLVAFPGARPRSPAGLVVVGLAYVAAGAAVASEGAWLLIFAAVAAVIAWQRRNDRGQRRRRRGVALGSAIALLAVLAAGSVARGAVSGGRGVLPALHAYEAVLVAVAAALALTLHRDQTPSVTDLVVELGEGPRLTLGDALAQLLGDPSLRVGMWSTERGAFIDSSGDPVQEVVSPSTATTAVGPPGEPVALLVHDRSLLDEPALRIAVAEATRLAGTHARLQAEIQAQVVQVEASRRRLLTTADEERAALERRLDQGPRRRLVALRESLETAREGASSRAEPWLAQAARQLDALDGDLGALSRGLHPRDLEDGLPAALRALAVASASNVSLEVADEVTTRRFPPEIEVACWYVCAEGLSNATKHAGATAVTVTVGVTVEALLVTVADDGRGGADPSIGSGLRGLGDRVATLGGALRIESPAGAGTRLVVELPLDDQPPPS